MNTKQVLVWIIVALFILIGMVASLKSKQKSNWPWSDDWNSANVESISQNEPSAPQENKPNQGQEQILAYTFEDAKKLSKENNKQILLFFTADWCSWCSKMKQEVLNKDEVKKELIKFVYFVVDADKEKSLLQKYSVKGLPSFVIAESNEKKVKSNSGYMDADKMIGWLN